MLHSIKVPDDRGRLFNAARNFRRRAVAGVCRIIRPGLYQAISGGGRARHLCDRGIGRHPLDGGPLVVATHGAGKVRRQSRASVQGSDPANSEEYDLKAARQNVPSKSKVERKGECCTHRHESRTSLGTPRGKPTSERNSSIRWRSSPKAARWCRPCSAPGPIFAVSYGNCGPSCRASSRRCAANWPTAGSASKRRSICRRTSIRALTLQAKDAEAAEIFAKLWHDLPRRRQSSATTSESSSRSKATLNCWSTRCRPRSKERASTIGFPTDASQFAQLGVDVQRGGEQVDGIEPSHESGMNRFKQLLLAMLNYESARQAFAAGRDLRQRRQAAAELAGRDVAVSG